MANASAASTPALNMAPVGQQARNLFDSSLVWFGHHWLQIVIAAGIGVTIFLILAVLRSLGTRLRDKHGDTLGFMTILGNAISRTSSFFLAMVAAKLVSGYAQPPHPVAATVQFLFVVSAVFQAAIWARELILGFIERRSGIEGQHETLSNAMGIIRLLVSFAVFAIALVVVLQNLGVNVTGLVAGLGIGGIAIGLAAQGVFEDLFAALSIIFDRPFRAGESIRYDGTSASVERVGLKSTRLRAFTGEEKIISNKNLLSKEISNYTRLQKRRIKLSIGVIYQTDPDVALRLPDLLKEIVEAEGGVFVRSGFVGFGASSVDFELEFDVVSTDYAVVYGTRHRIGITILKRFAAEGIEIAYPTQTTFTADPQGRMIMPYPQVMPVHDIPQPEGS